MSLVVDSKFEYELNGKKVYPKILKCDLDSEATRFAIDTSIDSLKKYSVEKDISEYIKEVFDNKYGQFWHVIVGNDFSVSLTHNSKFFLFYQIEKLYFALFKL